MEDKYKTILRQVLSRFRIGDFHPLLRRWGRLGDKAVSQIALKQSKASIVSDVIVACEEKGYLRAAVAHLDLIYTQEYSVKKKWTAHQMTGDQGNGKETVLDPRTCEKQFRRRLKLFFKKCDVRVSMYKDNLWIRVYIKDTPGRTYYPINTTYIVYCPRTPFFLISRIKATHRQYIMQTVLMILQFNEVKDMKLTGHCVNSLMELCMNKNSQGSVSKYKNASKDTNPLCKTRVIKRKAENLDFDKRIGNENIADKRRRIEVLDSTFGTAMLPTLEHVEYKMDTKFHGKQMAQKMSNVQFRCIVKFGGPSVLEGIRNLGECGIATVPLPNHLTAVQSLVKNHFTLVEKIDNDESLRPER